MIYNSDMNNILFLNGSYVVDAFSKAGTTIEQ